MIAELSAPDLAAVWTALSRLGVTPKHCARLVEQVTEVPSTLAPLQALHGQVDAGDQAFERTVLLQAAALNRPRIDQCPVPETVKVRLHQEFDSFAKPRKQQPLVLGSSAFSSACKFATLRRFPAGPLDWEVSGFPRSWVRRAGRNAPRLLAFLLTRIGGFQPLFFTHVARPPLSRSLVLEKEVMRTYYRIAGALRMQPEIKGIMTSAWFHEREMVRERPHMEPVNRPYLEHGGLIVSVPVELDYEPDHPWSGREGLALWPRDAVLEWADAHAEFDETRVTASS